MTAISVRPSGLVSILSGLAVSLIAPAPVHGQTRIDAAGLYLVPGTFVPGSVAQTQFIFYSVDTVELSTFSFSLRWDSDQVALQGAGPGSLAAWAQTLAPYGVLTWHAASATEIVGRWTATDQAWQLSPAHKIEPLLWFDTLPTQRTPVHVTFDLPSLLYSDGVPVDTGSGFYNSTTLSPVPQAPAAPCLVVGMAMVWARAKRTVRTHSAAPV